MRWPGFGGMVSFRHPRATSDRRGDRAVRAGRVARRRGVPDRGSPGDDAPVGRGLGRRRASRSGAAVLWRRGGRGSGRRICARPSDEQVCIAEYTAHGPRVFSPRWGLVEYMCMSAQAAGVGVPDGVRLGRYLPLSIGVTAVVTAVPLLARLAARPRTQRADSRVARARRGRPVGAARPRARCALDAPRAVERPGLRRPAAVGLGAPSARRAPAQRRDPRRSRRPRRPARTAPRCCAA